MYVGNSLSHAYCVPFLLCVTQHSDEKVTHARVKPERNFANSLSCLPGLPVKSGMGSELSRGHTYGLVSGSHQRNVSGQCPSDHIIIILLS